MLSKHEFLELVLVGWGHEGFEKLLVRWETVETFISDVVVHIENLISVSPCSKSAEIVLGVMAGLLFNQRGGVEGDSWLRDLNLISIHSSTDHGGEGSVLDVLKGWVLNLSI